MVQGLAGREQHSVAAQHDVLCNPLGRCSPSCIFKSIVVLAITSEEDFAYVDMWDQTALSVMSVISVSTLLWVLSLNKHV
jgi:hypothetical protein